MSSKALFDDFQVQLVSSCFMDAEHTMSSEALRRYVIESKLSREQYSLIGETEKIEVHAIPQEYVEDFLSERKLKPKTTALRRPRREKTYNTERPRFVLCEDRSGIETLIVFCFPSREYVVQYAEILAAGRYYASINAGTGAAPYSKSEISVYHYPRIYSSLVRWSGLAEAASQIIRAGDIVVMGHADEFIEYAAAASYELNAIYAVESVSGREFCRITVVARSGRRILVAGFVESFWGSASGEYAKCFADCGATDIVYMSKCGTFIGSEDVHTVAIPQYFHLLIDLDSDRHRPKIVAYSVESEFRASFDRITTGVFSQAAFGGIHLTVPTVLGETIEQAELYAKLNPATIDNEDTYIAAALTNARRSKSAACHFTALHFTTDYLITKAYRESERSKHDLAETSTEKRRLQNEAFQLISLLICRYADHRTVNRNPTTFLLEKYKRPSASGRIFGRETMISSLSAEISRRLSSVSCQKPIIVLYGQKSVGKSSVASSIFNSFFDAGRKPIWIDCRDVGAGSSSPSASDIALDLIAEVEGLSDRHEKLRASDFSDRLLGLSRAMSQSPTLVVFDNFEALMSEQLPGRIEGRHVEFAKLIEGIHAAGSACLITSAEKIAFSVFSSVKNIQVKGLTLEGFRDLADTLDFDFAPTTIERVWEYTGGNPKVGAVVLSGLSEISAPGADIPYAAIQDYPLSLEGLLEDQIARLFPGELSLLLAIGVFNTTVLPLQEAGLFHVSGARDLLALNKLCKLSILEPSTRYGEYRISPFFEASLRAKLKRDRNLFREYSRRAFEYFGTVDRPDPDSWGGITEARLDLCRIQFAVDGELFQQAGDILLSKSIRRSLNRIGAYDFMVQMYGCLVALPVQKRRLLSKSIPYYRARAYNLIGIALRASGRTEEAIDAFKKGLRCAAGSMSVRAMLLGNLCYAYSSMGRPARAAAISTGLKAIAAANSAILYGEDSGDSDVGYRNLAYAHGNLGVAFLANGENATALYHFRKDIRYSLAEGDNPEGIASARGYISAAICKRCPILALKYVSLCLRYFAGVENEVRERHFLRLFLEKVGDDFRSSMIEPLRYRLDYLEDEVSPRDANAGSAAYSSDLYYSFLERMIGRDEL